MIVPIAGKVQGDSGEIGAETEIIRGILRSH